MAVPASWAVTSHCFWMAVLYVTFQVAAPYSARAQGLRPDLAALARSGTTFATFSQAYGQSVAWRNAMQASTRSACSAVRGNLCGSTSEEAALLLATAPQAFDARNRFGNVQVVGPVKDQGECGMCVAFSVLAAAQTAAAVALRQSFNGVTLSEQDYYMCRTVEQFLERGCSTGWSLEKGMLAFAKLQSSKQLPVVEACRRYEPLSGAPCSRTCTTTLPQLLQGEYRVKPLGSIAEMQRHIRQHGSIVCRMQLFSDIKPFFRANPGAVYKGPGPGARMEDAHAVQVVGYNNSRQAWLIKNSWGPRFAVKGFAWVAFDAPSMCDRQDTYGFVFTLSQPKPDRLSRLTPAPGRQGCFTYRAVAGDYPEGLASRVGIPVQRLLLDNLDIIKDPSTLPAGTTLLLCNISPAVAAGEGPGGPPAVVGDHAPNSNSSAASDEVGALLAIKRVLDPPGTALKDWQPGEANPCGWTGVICGDGKRVTGIDFWDAAAQDNKVQLSGRLPTGALLSRLPGLMVINMVRTRVGGTLPEDWSQLTQLTELFVAANQLNGTLPPSWGALSKLRVCRMTSNTLSGPLPSAWSGMATLEELKLSFNRGLTGTLPPTWSQLSALRDLQMTSCTLSGTLPPSWGALSRLGVCDLASNRLSGPLPDAWSGMTALEQLELNSNNLTGTLPSTWSRLVALKELYLGGNKLSGTLPPSWGALTKLRMCFLNYNTLSGPLPGAWSGMAALEHLALHSNALTGTVPPSWGTWGKLREIGLFSNPQLAGCLPAAWRGAVKVIPTEPFRDQDSSSFDGTGISGFC